MHPDRFTGTSQLGGGEQVQVPKEGNLQLQSWDWDPRGGEGTKSCSF